SHLPLGISGLWVKPVDESFHARFDAHSRQYRYVILNRQVRPALEAGRVTWCREALDVNAMNQAAQALRGEHDFTSFRASACQARHAVREIHDIAVRRRGDYVTLEVTANAFLYHMVRNIAGTLMEVGTGRAEPGWVGEVLGACDRDCAGITAPPDGLYFVRVRYPGRFGLPSRKRAFPFSAP
ncbi:MAG: tRNA pseudouridine synthase A, partial [Xanthomonadales bacterium]|nr:tRNA pseudouridine synthase A [Xanthomonadales bacterium]